MALLFWLRNVLERAMTRRVDGRRTFFEPAAFPWVAAIESEWRAIRAELESVLRRGDAIPNFQDISPEQASLTSGDMWKTYFLLGYGHRLEAHCARCPETMRLLGKIPGVMTAMFSIFAPGAHIRPHRGPYKGVLRYHLGLIVPRPEPLCRIRVGRDIRYWKEGQSLIFDDTFEHEVWNEATGARVVLFVDIVRPLPFPLSLLNRLMIAAISRTRFVRTAVDRARRL
jgi:aspartyl/asparaginyl beta-hydroxylase (cupin superfamily)